MEKNSDSDEPDFQTSPLGTKEFWEDSFKRDLFVYMERKEIDDIWFGQESVDRVLKWLKESEVDKNKSIIDIGCGNGATLLALASEGYTDLWGVDYSTSAIKLASTVCADKDKCIRLQEYDFLQDFSESSSDENDASSLKVVSATDATNNNTIPNNINNNFNHNTTNTTTSIPINNNKNSDSFLDRQYDICLDKGTYDAICLKPEDRCVVKKRYKENLARICKDGGLFILTSCNWTRDELTKQFNSHFDVMHQIPTRTFEFGGVVGHGETVLVMKKIRH